MSSLFILDTAGDKNLNESNSLKGTAISSAKKRKTLDAAFHNKESKSEAFNANDDEDFFGLPPPSVDFSDLIDKTLEENVAVESRKTQALAEIDVSIDAALAARAQVQQRPHHKRVIDLDHTDFNMETGKFDDEQLLKINVEAEMENSIIKPGFEALKAQPTYSEQKKQRLNRLERAKTKGGDWYNLPATEMTEEVENELKILQMRSVLDPKHFYKKNDLKVLPKYFQIGKVLPSPLDHFKERDVRKNKKRSLVDELLADTEFQSFNKRKYNEAMARKQKYTQRKAMKKMKKLKKNK